MLRGRVLGTYRRELAGVDLDELAAAGRAVLADGEPRSMGDLARAVAARWPDAGPRPLGELLVAALIPTVQLPPRGLWRTRAGVRNAPVADWLGRDVDPPAPPGTDPVGEELVRRYLAAFGPAASADLRAWCGLAGLPAAVAAVRGELVSFRDERGRELLDLPGAPRPDPGTPAPVRFLPAFDKRGPRLPGPRPDHRRPAPRPVGHRRPLRPRRREGLGDLDRQGRHGDRRPTAPAHPAGARRGRRGGAGPRVLPLRGRERPCHGRGGTALSGRAGPREGSAPGGVTPRARRRRRRS
ncbi:hypothetical protein SLI_7751 [Streptomyces lividans 1326]|uniref:Winged helix DNA-binding domain-containing protein n=1 Tax=Streptomyces lividans 1326 TaxID=1200984 RepID=A0A7U9HFB3_STRLI|nr:hypothetical protein SLI_7751 [Streptomyces lividans 1326]